MSRDYPRPLFACFVTAGPPAGRGSRGKLPSLPVVATHFDSVG